MDSVAGDVSSGRRKRPRVADEHRKRTARACENCRKMKERCQGGQPCERCTRIGRPCEVLDPQRQSQGQEEASRNRDEFLDVNRIKLLERIVAHFTAVSCFDIATLTSAAASIDFRPPSCSQRGLNPQNFRHTDAVEDGSSVIARPVSPSLDSGELSHSKFSTRVRARVDSQLHGGFAEFDEGVPQNDLAPTPVYLHSKSLVVSDIATTLPPSNVANFLLDVFSQFAQTNYSYVDDQSIRRKLRDFYTHSPILTIEDAPWLSTILMMFAIGTQFAHLSSTHEGSEDDQIQDHNDPHAGDDEVALSFYHSACKLIPDIMTAASVQSVQAFLLFGVFTLPMDPAGLSCTYLGIAIKIATQNNLHRRNHRNLNPRQIELRKRIWWTAYTLERRICILHGRPVSIMRTEVNLDMPVNFAGLKVRSGPDVLPNILAMIKLTGILEEARDILSTLKKGSVDAKSSILGSLLALKQALCRYWNSLPHDVLCRDLTPSKPLFRYNTHLALTYHLIHIFIGRSFIFDKSEDNISNEIVGDMAGMRNVLVEECIQSALAVVKLCQDLHDGVGLARASYTESSTCCAALLALLARRITSEDDQLKPICEKGMALLRRMLVGIYSNSQDKTAVEVLDAAVRRLRRVSEEEEATESDTSNYAQFKNWVGVQRSASRDLHVNYRGPNHDFDGISGSLQTQPTTFDSTGHLMLNQSELNELSILPGLVDWFEFSVD